MFPMFEFALSVLTVLPVEMLAFVLRYLDAESLMNTALTNKRFMKVCRGDPVLRMRIRMHVKEEKELQRQALMDAKRGLVVTRMEPSKIFSGNSQKSVSFQKVKPIKAQDIQRGDLPTAQPFRMVRENKRRNGGGKIRRQRKERVGPYSNLRFFF